jgi:hypothetical protein
MEVLKELFTPYSARKEIWRARRSRIREYLRFAVQQRRMGFEIGDHPWLDEESSPVFERMIENCSSYLEYGSGGSTVFAARLNKPFVTVDTDRFFLEAVRRKIERLASDQHLLYGNIGWTTEYGYPIFTTPRASRQKKWKAYIEMPWLYLESGRFPDLVMIDGRFRVAAALTSCLHLAQSPAKSKIVIDDYAERPQYHVIEKYLRLVGMAGRMAIFESTPQNSANIREVIQQHLADPR